MTRERKTSLQLPAVGLGLWKSKPGEVHAAVKEALARGYRLLDSAEAYNNEEEVGNAIAEAMSEGIVRREDIWVVSKLFNHHHVWDGDTSRPATALAQTLRDLQLEDVDCYLMHWPVAFKQSDLSSLGGQRLADGTPNPKIELKVEFLETWAAMLELKRSGRVKHLGVCNFSVEQLEELLRAFPDACDQPEVNQVEIHPYLAQDELVAFCRAHGIAIMAYSSLGSGDSYSGRSFPAQGTGPFECPHGGAPLLQNSLVQQLADKHRVSPAEVLIHWSVARGFCCLTKSVRPERIQTNVRAPDALRLSEEDMAALRELDCGFRYGIGYLPGCFDCPNAPWFKQASGRGISAEPEA